MLNANQKSFIKAIQAAAGRQRASEVLTDFAHMAALEIRATFVMRGKVEIMADWQRTRANYTDKEYAHLVEASQILIESLDERREEFLGSCREELGATNTHNGQFLTPVSISQMLGRIMLDEPRDEVITLHDPCCGCGVLLIEGAEEALKRGWKLHNLCIVAGDIDGRALDMCYTQLTLLGYAGAVKHMDALTQEQFGETMYTPGWFLHGFPMRRISA